MTVRVSTCVPPQHWDIEGKLGWLDTAVSAAQTDLFLLPQEWVGGHMSEKNGGPLHVEEAWLEQMMGAFARRKGVALGVGAAVREARSFGRSFEEYWYFDADGRVAGRHRKLALPSYDDIEKDGAGGLTSETDGLTLAQRVQPVELLGLKIGTVFCWEVFSLGLFPAYARAGVDLVCHPIKFSPPAWPILTPNKGTGELRRVVGFRQDKENTLWEDKLIMASRHETLGPVAVSCNSWALGWDYAALVGHVDEVAGTTQLEHVPCGAENEFVHTFDVAVRDLKAPEFRHWAMHRKLRAMGL